MDALTIKHFYNPEDPDLFVLKLSGYVDSTNSMQLDKALEEVLRSGRTKIIFDFSEVHYVSSAGWGVFVGQVKTVRDKGGDIRIAAMQPDVHDVFNVLEFFHIVNDYNSLDEALLSFSDKQPENGKADREEAAEGSEEAFSVFEPIENLLKLSGVKPSLSTRPETEEDKKTVLFRDGQRPAPKRPEEVEKSAPVPQTQKSAAVQPANTFPQPARVQQRKPLLAGSRPASAMVAVDKLPLSEKIKRLVAAHPLLTNRQMRKTLRGADYGHEKVGRFRLRRALRRLNLETKEKRYRYYLST